MAHRTPDGPTSSAQPGWYVDPEEPWLLRRWDGKTWSEQVRPRPNWLSRDLALEVQEEDLDRCAAEGPSRSQEVRAPLARGGRSAPGATPWPPRSPRQAAGRGPRPRPQAPGLTGRPRSAASNRLSQARRPLVVMASLVAVAAAVAVSSIVTMRPPYGPASRLLAQNSQPSLSSFAKQASKDCAATLPQSRPALEAEADGPSIALAAQQVDLLRRRLASIPISQDVAAPVKAWLQDWQEFTSSELRYAELIGPAHYLGRQARPSPRASGPAASQALYEAERAASNADTYSVLLRASACRLEAQPLPGA
ncbi:MAG: DUF2510 domain-containing protein [Acidimicrobiales bacterium]